jgi:glycosyltransferase involved in cell wall biosynthesis
MDSLISVIVPVYKVEDYLPRCVDSIINQSYKNLEIILVDDGSPDNCPKICDEYAKNDNRIKVIHKKNGGLSDARNAGMKVATGEYISFIDSDDYVSSDFIEILCNTMISENSDIVECSIVKFYEDNHFDDYKDDCDISCYETEEGLSKLIAENPFHQYVWNKLYRANLVLDIKFAVGKLNEDEFWTYQAFGKAKKVSRINKTIYFYFQRKSSIMGNKYNLRRLDALEGKYNRQLYIEEAFPNLVVQSKIDFFGSCIFACQSAMKFLNRDDRKKAKIMIRKYIGLCKLDRLDIQTLHGKMKFWFSFANVSFTLCCKIRNILGIGF